VPTTEREKTQMAKKRKDSFFVKQKAGFSILNYGILKEITNKLGNHIIAEVTPRQPHQVY
jgi:hypothetical protein